MQRHPDLTEDDVRTAWEEAVVSAPRVEKDPDEYVSTGFDGKGRAIEMVAVRKGARWLIYHAMTPPTRRVLRELGQLER